MVCYGLYHSVVNHTTSYKFITIPFFMKIVILHRILLVFPFKKPLFLAIFVRFSQLKKIFSFSMENFRAKCYHGIYRIGMVASMV